MTSRSDNITTILARNVHKSVTAKELATFLGLSSDVSVTSFGDTTTSEMSTVTFQINVSSLDEAMAIFKKHNFTELKQHFVSLEFFPAQIYNTIPEIQIELPSFVGPEDSQLRINGHFPRFVNLKNCSLNAPDFWTPPKVPEKAKGNLIDVPMNVTDAKRSITQVAHVVPTLAEGMNVTGRGNIMAMKCLESGHLVTSSTTVNGGSTLHVWDMRDNLEQAKIPVALINSEPWPKVWFDARGMDVCSVDHNGTISSYDLYKTVSSNSHTSTTSVDRSAVTDIDTEYRFYSTGISINGFDSTVLVGSSEHAQIAHWDPRSPSLAARTTTACRVKDATSVQRRFFDPVYDIEWNPNNSNEFMSVHSSTIRVWDVRKMDHDAYATFHHMGMPIRKARWSPHHSDCVAGLTMDGVVKIWKVKKFDGPVNVTTPQQHPDELFLHRAQDRTVSDFAWNPYVEDVISTVCPGTEENPGCIQVWRPRNLHDSDENGEP
ncbi:hypothetical protein BGZ58_007914 [Dissophora ornata]|nr:hypothetical protein BGZ58_007914 [Dissophora ornata]